MREIQHIVKNRYRTLVCLPSYEPEFIVGNKLSKKPKEAAKKLKEVVEGKNSICKSIVTAVHLNMKDMM